MRIKSTSIAPLLLAIWLLFQIPFVSATDYYVSNSGNDSNTGTSVDAPWATLYKVNNFDFAPGDVVHFQRGGIWRGMLVPRTGGPGAHVIYTAYGNPNDPKPQIIGSLEMNDPGCWTNEGNNIWSTPQANVTGSEILLNPSFDTGTTSWACYFSTIAGASGSVIRDTTVYDTLPASYKVICTNPGTNSFDIQLYTEPLQITGGKQYKLTFRAKCTSSFTIQSVLLRKPVSPWTDYFSSHTNWSPTITTQWATYTIYYESNVTASDARITFFLGRVMPAGSTLWIDTLSFKELDRVVPLEDVGNIIFNNSICGTKVWYKSYVNGPTKFYYDGNQFTVKVYSTQNPALAYSDIELARGRLMVNAVNKSYINFDNLALAYGGSNGIELCASCNVNITSCDLSYIGGADQDGFSGLLWTRLGNAIEAWGNAHDITIENCHIWQVYDAGVTNQGSDTNSQYNIYYLNNTIENCEYAYELWDRPSTSTMYNIHFENNICRNAGGWGHSQRPDPFGVFVMCYSSSATIPGNIYIRNNTFDTAIYAAVNMTTGFTDVDKVMFDENVYFNPVDSPLVRWNGVYYYTNPADFAQYKAVTGKDANSILNPVIVSGTVQLKSYTADVSAVPVTIEIRSPGSSTALETQTVNLDANGRYSFITYQVGSFDLTAKASNWLRQKKSGNDLAVGSNIADFTLINGDANNDNRVDVVDLGILATNYGKLSGATGSQGDFNGDGAVNVIDLGILATNYGASGAGGSVSAAR